MEKTFDNDNFICFVELYEKTLTTCNRHGTVRGSDDLTEFIHEIRLYRQYQKNMEVCVQRGTRPSGGFQRIEKQVEVSAQRQIYLQAITLIKKSERLNRWAVQNAAPFIVRKIRPDEDPIKLADELLKTLYVPLRCL